MRIALCDNNKAFLGSLARQVQRFSFVTALSCYSDIRCFFDDLQAGRSFDTVLMDLDWDSEENGLTYAEQLYRVLPQMPVIYITGYNDRFSQHVLLKNTHLAGYLTKPVSDPLLEQYLQKVLKDTQAGASFSFHQKGQAVSIPAGQVVYLESRNHTCTVYTETAAYTVYEKLSQLLQRLPDSFIQCHKSYAVNMHRIRRLEAGKILLQNGRTVSVSRAFAASTRDRVLAFMGLQL